MTVPISSITDRSRGVFKLTGPCSMADPCPGDTCREHPETSTAAAGGEATADVEPHTVSTLSARCHIALPDGRLVVWESNLYDWHRPGEWSATCQLYKVDGETVEQTSRWHDEPVPAWVPRPPDGWDSGVRIEAERRAIAAITDEFGLQRCPCCDGDGVVPRPWPSPDRDPVACPVCDQAGRVTPEVRVEWLGWHEGQAS